MKKPYFIFFISILIYLNSYAQLVSNETARQVARNIYYERANIEKPLAYKDVIFGDEYTLSDNGLPLLYIYNISANRGFVVASAEKQAAPVLFYCFNGAYSPAIQNDNFLYWLDLFKKQIKYVRTQTFQKDITIEKYWNYYSSPSIALTKDVNAVSPLVTANWNQDCFYNASCPTATFGPCGKCYAGCVADAMAMVMKYHNYPTHGYSSHSYVHSVANGYSNNFGTLSANFGSTTYNWASMPDNVNSSNSAVATLISHCGISVNMDYDGGGSAANLADAAGALVTYFIYSAQYTYRSIYSNDDWASLIKNSLDSLRPVLYAGSSGGSGGHAFVCDGYQNSGTYSNMFHFNWGWSGTYNGYIYLSDISPSGSFESFNDYQQIVYNIYPKPATLPEAGFTANTTSIPVNSLVVFTNTSTNNPLDYLWSVTPNAGISFVGSTSTTTKNAIIKFTTPGYYTISLQVTNSAGTDTETKNNFIYVYAGAGVEETGLSESILIYPNPAKDIIVVSAENNIISDTDILIYDAMGKKVREKNTGISGDKNNVQIDLSDLLRGVYFVTIKTNDQIFTKKVVLTR